MRRPATVGEVAELRAAVARLRRRVARVEAGQILDFRDCFEVLGTWGRMKEAARWWEAWFTEMEQRKDVNE